MLSRHYYNVPGRTAAVLTTAAVGSTPYPVGASVDGWLTTAIDFTLGSLTNGIFNPQVSNDGTKWYDITDPGLLTLTATGTKTFSVNCKGWKLFRVAVTGTGTVTSSSATITYGYQINGGAFG